MSRLPETGPSLRRYLTQQKRQANRAGNASPFTRSGSGVTAENEVTYEGVLKVLGQMVVDGILTVNGPLAVHGTAAFDGDTTIGGNAAITGTLSLPAGIIDNAALASPVTGDVGNNYVLTAVTSSWANYAGVSIAVPAGFTRAQVMAVSSVIGPTTDTWQIRVDIAGVTGAEYTVFGNNGALGFAHNLTGLSGGSITVATGVRNAIASGNNRGIATSATVTFLR